MFEDLTDAVIYEAVNGRFNLDLGSLGFLQSLIRTGNKLGQDGGRISAITIGLRVWAVTMDLGAGGDLGAVIIMHGVGFQIRKLPGCDKKSDRGSLKPVMAENWVINV